MRNLGMSPILMLSLAIAAPAVLGAATLALPRRALGLRVLISILAPGVSLAMLIGFVTGPGVGAAVTTVQWMPQLHLNFQLHANPLAMFFALLVAAIGLLIAIYARAYFGRDEVSLYRFYPSLHLFMTAMLGIVLSDNFLLLLLFWELTSISSFLLIGWERNDDVAVRNALQAFVITNAGGLCLMAAFVLVGMETGAWRFSELAASVAAGGVPATGFIVTGFVLIFCGAAAKSAQWPVHVWLPGAMAAPTPVSAYLHSATMVKAGIYLIGQFWPVLSALWIWPKLIIPIGAVTMVLGAYVALRKSDLKQIFAYSTISQLGLLMTMYGLGGLTYEDEPNLLWDVTQILNHALYKAPLFILAGAIGHAIHTRELPLMRGLIWRGGSQAIMAALLIAAAYALAALPLTLSFTAKELFFYQVYHAFGSMPDAAVWLLIVAGVATGMFNVAIFVRITRVLLGRPVSRPHSHDLPPAIDDPAAYVAHQRGIIDEGPSTEDIDIDPHDRGFWPAMLWVPAALLIALQFISGLIPGAHAWLFGWLERPQSMNYTFRTAHDFPMSWQLLAHPGVPLYMSLAAIASGILLGLAPVLTRVINDIHEQLFPLFYKVAVEGGSRVFRLFQTGYFRTYITLYALTFVALFIWTAQHVRDYLRLDLHTQELFSRPMLPGYLLGGLMCAAAVLMTVVRHRAGRVLVLGVAGVAATSLFYIYQAPDLALTQVSIEVVSLILFLLVLALLPRERLQARTLVVPRILLSLTTGAVMAMLTLAATTGERPQRVIGGGGGETIATLGDYFLRNSAVGRDALAVDAAIAGEGVVDRGIHHPDSFGSHPMDVIDRRHPDMADGAPANLHKGGGGANVVNVILVDFRGFDTLGEITVLALAALGVWTLFRRRVEEAVGPTPLPESRGPGGVAFPMTTIILLQAAKLLVPLALLVSAYIFFKGHQSPGGGFVGGLVAAVALILYRMCTGEDALQRLIRVRERTLISLGLLLAAGTGAASLMAGLPFLTSNNGYLPLPGGEAFHWATVMFFDAGVFLVVVGVTVGMIDVLSSQIERAKEAA